MIRTSTARKKYAKLMDDSQSMCTACTRSCKKNYLCCSNAWKNFTTEEDPDRFKKLEDGARPKLIDRKKNRKTGAGIAVTAAIGFFLAKILS
jgi:epoxyqueuosine reductase QueG